MLVAQSCPILCDPTNCSLPGFSVHGILQARILEWIAIPFSRGSSWPRDRSLVSCIAGRFFTVWATGKSLSILIKNQLAVNVWAYFCTLSSVLFICISVLLPVPCCFDYCSFVVNYQLRSTLSNFGLFSRWFSLFWAPWNSKWIWNQSSHLFKKNQLDFW